MQSGPCSAARAGRTAKTPRYLYSVYKNELAPSLMASWMSAAFWTICGGWRGGGEGLRGLSHRTRGVVAGRRQEVRAPRPRWPPGPQLASNRGSSVHDLLGSAAGAKRDGGELAVLVPAGGSWWWATSVGPPGRPPLSTIVPSGQGSHSDGSRRAACWSRPAARGGKRPPKAQDHGWISLSPSQAPSTAPAGLEAVIEHA
jgi:hypothetical protein